MKKELKNLDAMFKIASKEYDKNNYKKAFDIFLKLANHGYTHAYNNLAVMYECGLGTKKSNKKAISLYKRSVKSGHKDSCFNIGDLYKKSGNIERAKYWFKKGASANDGESALELLKIYITSTRRMMYKKNIDDLYLIAISKKYSTVDTINEAKKIRQNHKLTKL